MANMSVQERALKTVALFEAHGRKVTRITIKGKEISFSLQEEATPANSLEQLLEMDAHGKK